MAIGNPLTFVGIGEVLYDLFEDGTENLGGAPLNFTVHVHQLAKHLGIGHGTIVSRIGSDQRGQAILDSLHNLGISTRYLGKDDSRPTGLVSVFMRDGEPGYQIESETAWDYLEDKPLCEELARQCEGICFGSLAQRSELSRNSIRAFLQNAPQANRLYDINLRQNTLTGECGYSPEIVEYSCRMATIIKANRSELFSVLDLLGIVCPIDQTINGIRRGMGMLLEHFRAKTIMITLGAEGIAALDRNGKFNLSTPIKTVETPHPVGAGDACSAGILFGITLGWDIHASIELANRMGADVASHPSATPPLSDETLRFARAQLRVLSR
jgi:fructokinase